MQLPLFPKVVTAEERSSFDAFVSEVNAENSRSARNFLVDYEAQQVAEFRAKSRNLVAHYSDGRQVVPESRSRKDAPVKGQLRIRAYAHNRVTMCAYMGGKRYVGRRMKMQAFCQAAKPAAALVLGRETRRGYEVGGRWRFLPLKTKFTSTARNWIRDAGYVMETESDGHALFVTLTIAGEGEEVNRCLSACSGYIVDRLNRWLRYRCMDGWFVYVWELQKRGTPHLHYMIKRENFDYEDGFGEELKSEWRKILLDVSRESGVDLFCVKGKYSWIDDAEMPWIHITTIQTSMGGYMAKYASKVESKSGSQNAWFPGRWSGISYPLRKKVLSRRLDIILGCETVESSAGRLLEILSDAGELFDKTWQPALGIPGIEAYVSAITVPGCAREIVAAIAEWLVFGDVNLLQSVLQRARACLSKPRLTENKNAGE